MARNRGMPDARGEKRVKRPTVNLGPKMMEALEQLSKHEQRTVSAVVGQVLERDPVVKTFLQRIELKQGH